MPIDSKFNYEPNEVLHSIFIFFILLFDNWSKLKTLRFACQSIVKFIHFLMSLTRRT